MPDGILLTTLTSLANKKSQLRAQASNSIKYIRQELENIAQEIVQEAQEYPPELEKQKYVRTYTFQGSWDIGLVETTNNGSLVLEITNDAADKYETYASAVMGDPVDEFDEAEEEQSQGQREIHQGRWKLLSEIQASHSHEQANRIAGAIRRGLNS